MATRKAEAAKSKTAQADKPKTAKAKTKTRKSPVKASSEPGAAPAVAISPETITAKKKRGGQPGNKGGRPKSLIDDERTVKEIEILAKVQCTKEEAAAFLGVCYNTFDKFLKDSKSAAEAWGLGQNAGKASAKRAIYANVMKGNTTAQVWWSKNVLGWTDKSEVTTNHPVVPASINISFDANECAALS